MFSFWCFISTETASGNLSFPLLKSAHSPIGCMCSWRLRNRGNWGVDSYSYTRWCCEKGVVSIKYNKWQWWIWILLLLFGSYYFLLFDGPILDLEKAFLKGRLEGSFSSLEEDLAEVGIRSKPLFLETFSRNPYGCWSKSHWHWLCHNLINSCTMPRLISCLRPDSGDLKQ